MSAQIESVLQESRVFQPPEAFVRQANVAGMAQYEALCAEAEKDHAGFWARLAREQVLWHKPFTRSLDASGAPFYKWFEDGELNVSYNCLDRHLGTPVENKTAIIFEADDGSVAKVTYKELHAKVCQFANGLRALGCKKGERAIIYMPMSVEGIVAMQACARLGLIHSVVFGGFSAKSLQERIQDAGATLVIAADEQVRGGKRIPLKPAVDEAFELGGCGSVRNVVVYQRTGAAVAMKAGRDLTWAEVVKGQADQCEPEWVGAEHPLFILYTSGSTGKPKGVQHSSGGYLLHAMLTMKWTFDIKPSDIFWCTADIGWVTGHTYITYGPLACGATEIVFEGVPTYPNAGRFWDTIAKHKVNIFYTAPTAIRALMGQGREHVDKWDLSSLRILGSVGEPINPEAWNWYNDVVGKGTCPIVDTWWQTETGGILISPLPGATPTKPGSATKPFFGVQPVVLEPASGAEIAETQCEGVLALADSWPGQMRTIYGDHERFVDTYFSQYKGYYFSGDGCRRDADGYYWITGRVDDVINVSGHRMGTAEVESALVAHPKVSEAAVVGYPHDIKGQGIYAYVTLNAGEEYTEELRKELRTWVRKEIGPIASPDLIQWAPGLPKTRSGKIMRRILRKIAENDYGALGDTSTLADPGVVDDLIEQRMNKG